MKIKLFLLLTIIILNSCSDILGTTYKIKININGVQIKKEFPISPPKGNYKLNVIAVGNSDCIVEYKLLMNGKVYQIENIKSKPGKFNKTIYSGDWYDATPGLIISPQENNCNGDIMIKYTYYY